MRLSHGFNHEENRYKRYERWRDSRGGEGREVKQENKKFDDEIETAREKERKRGKDHGAFRDETHGSRAVG